MTMLSGLSVRARNALLQLEIKTERQFLDRMKKDPLTVEEILRLPNAGRVSVHEIAAAYYAHHGKFLSQMMSDEPYLMFDPDLSTEQVKKRRLRNAIKSLGSSPKSDDIPGLIEEIEVMLKGWR